jgi:hypothetical protein
MARMYPKVISASTASNAERRLFTELERQLPDDYAVFHSVSWKVRGNGTEHYGEADFLVAHPLHGIAVIEVKGGRLEGEWGADRWTSIDRNGHQHSTKNPFKQAESAKWNLGDALARGPRTGSFRYPHIRHAVAFPTMLTKDIDFGPNADPAMVIASSDLNAIEPAIERVLNRDPRQQRMSDQAMHALRDLLAPTVTIDRPGLAYSLKEGDQRILELTNAQYSLLEFLRHQRQAVINGCAGSGKTMLAIEKAIRLAEDGHQVLLTCFNKNLAAWMASVVAAQPASIADAITVRHYHDLAVHLCDEAGVPTQVGHADQPYWDEGLAADLARAIPLLSTRYDAIVVDEGQDFNASWWITLQDLLSRPDGIFYIFQDEQQAIYHRERDLLISTAPYPLTSNVRSTATIHSEVIRYYAGDPKPTSMGPGGRAIETIAVTAESERSVLATVVARLVEEEGILPAQIVVLTPHGLARSTLRDGQLAGKVRLTHSRERAANDVLVSSIHAFKGLESDIVIFAETASLATSREGRMLTYVALSRAKHHLIVLGELPSLAA